MKAQIQELAFSKGPRVPLAWGPTTWSEGLLPHHVPALSLNAFNPDRDGEGCGILYQKVLLWTTSRPWEGSPTPQLWASCVTCVSLAEMGVHLQSRGRTWSRRAVESPEGLEEPPWVLPPHAQTGTHLLEACHQLRPVRRVDQHCLRVRRPVEQARLLAPGQSSQRVLRVLGGLSRPGRDIQTPRLISEPLGQQQTHKCSEKSGASSWR